FPNAATRPRRIKDEVDGLARELSTVKKDIDNLGKRVEEIDKEFRSLSDLRSRVDALELRSKKTESAESESGRFFNERVSEKEILKNAPPDVSNLVNEWHGAIIAGSIWACLSLLLVALSIFLLWRGEGVFVPNVFRDPINWLPPVLLLL